MATTQAAPPVAEGRDPALGHLAQLQTAPLPFLRSLRDQGDVVTIYIGPEPMHVVTEPKLVADVLVGRYGSFNRDRFAAANAQFVGHSTAVISGVAHRGRRQLMAPAFQRARMGRYVGEMVRIVEDRLAGWRDGDVRAMDDEAFALSLATSGTCLFGTDLPDDTLKAIHTQLMAALGEVADGVAERDSGATAEVRRMVTEIVTQRRADGVDRDDLISAFLKQLTDEEIVDEVVGLLAAGVDTPAVALSWVLHELTCHPEVERRVRDELDAVVGDNAVTEEHVRSLEYLHQVIQETLRRYAAYLLPSQADQDVELAGVRIPAGGVIAISLYAMHYDPRSFVDPERFDPDRWAAERVAAIERGTHIPFSTGNRKCPGDLFALTELTVWLATILTRFRLTPSGDEPVEASVHGFTIRPESLPMRLAAR